MYVPVVDRNQRPLMPTKPSRARRWIRERKATPLWKRGVFCVRLNGEPSGRNLQPVACGIDPGSKKEGLTVKSAAHTYLNLQADAVTWVKEQVKTRLVCLTPLRFHRRQLHRLKPEKGGIRRPYGGTRSHGFKRGSLVKHPKWGVAYVGGVLKDRISLHRLADGKRWCQNARPSACKFLAFNTWRTRRLTMPKVRGLRRVSVR